MLFPGDSFKRRISSSTPWSLAIVDCMEHLSPIRFRSLRMMLIFVFLDIAD